MKRNTSISDSVIYLMAAVAFIFLIVFRSQQFPGDSLSFAYDIKHGVDLFHPHHLLFSFLVFWFQKFLLVFSSKVDVLLSAQVFNSIWAAVGLIFSYKIARSLFGSALFGFCIALILLFTNMYWLFATSAEVYVPAMVSAMIVFYLLLEYRNTIPRKILIAAFISATVFFHQAGVFLVIPLVVYGWLKLKNLSAIFFIAALSASIVFISYIISFLSQDVAFTVDGFIHYVFAYAFGAQKDWGTGQAFSERGVLSLTANQALCILNYRVRETGGLNLSFFTLLVSSILWNVVKSIRVKEMRGERVYVLLWLLTNYIFLLWWTPGYELLIPTIFPLLLLLAFVLNDILKIVFHEEKFILRNFVSLFAFLVAFSLELYYNLEAFAQYHSEEGYGKMESDWVMKSMDDKTRLIDFYGNYIHLLYYNDYTQSIEVNRLLPAFYYHDTIPLRMRIQAEENELIPAWVLNPWFDSFGKNGWKHPAEWLSFFEYVLDVQIAKDSDGISYRDFEVIPSTGDNLPSLIKISAQRKEAENIQSLMANVDEKFREENIGVEIVYSDWAGKNQEVLQNAHIPYDK